jgi:hypothetical protein
VKFPIGGKVREPSPKFEGGTGGNPVPTVKVWMEEEEYFEIERIQF